MPKAFAPKVATSNHLLDGYTIYFTQPGWSRDLACAAIAETPEAAEALLAEAACDQAETVDVVLVDVDLSTGSPRPTHFRERYRAEGPDLAFLRAAADEEPVHV